MRARTLLVVNVLSIVFRGGRAPRSAEKGRTCFCFCFFEFFSSFPSFPLLFRSNHKKGRPPTLKTDDGDELEVGLAHEANAIVRQTKIH